MPNTPDLGISHITAAQSGKEVTANAAFDGLDCAIAGTAPIVCTAGGNIATTALASDGYVNWLHARLKLTGSPGAGFNLIVPLTNPKSYLIDNQSGQSVTVKGVTGATVTVATGNIQHLYCDGTDVLAMNVASSGGSTVVTMGGEVTGPSNAAIVGKQTQATLSGTTSGSAISAQPFQSGNFKKAIIYLNAYYNTSGTPQTITFPTAFTNTPVMTANTDPPCSATTTTFTLPSSMTTPVTGFAILEGY